MSVLHIKFQPCRQGVGLRLSVAGGLRFPIVTMLERGGSAEACGRIRQIYDILLLTSSQLCHFDCLVVGECFHSDFDSEQARRLPHGDRRHIYRSTATGGDSPPHRRSLVHTRPEDFLLVLYGWYELSSSTGFICIAWPSLTVPV